MKIAINCCFGGFGISDEAFEQLLNRKGIAFEREDTNSEFVGTSYYREGMCGTKEGYLSQYEYIENRSDPDLIAVIESLGEKANGWAAEIRIVEIPDDVEWHIAEYDGIEHIAENHRTWR